MAKMEKWKRRGSRIRRKGRGGEKANYVRATKAAIREEWNEEGEDKEDYKEGGKRGQ